MGLDFIRSTSVSHTKAWSAEFRKSSGDLFSQSCANVDRTYLASTIEKNALNEGDAVSVRLIDGHVLVYKDLEPVAEVEKPSLDLLESLNSCYGILAGQIDERNDLAGVVSVHVGNGSRK